VAVRHADGARSTNGVTSFATSWYSTNAEEPSPLGSMPVDPDHAFSGSADVSVPCAACPPDPLPWARGYIDPAAGFGCLMSYLTDADCPGFCGNAPFISSSDPTVTYKGRPTGTPLQDNARAVRENAILVFAYAQ